MFTHIKSRAAACWAGLRTHTKKLAAGVGLGIAAAGTASAGSFTPATFDAVTFPIDPVSMVQEIAGSVGLILVLVMGFVIGIKLIKKAGRRTASAA